MTSPPTLPPRLAIGEDALRRGKDADAETTAHGGNVVLADVDTEARATHPADACDHRTASLDRSAGRCAGRGTASLDHGGVGEIAPRRPARARRLPLCRDHGTSTLALRAPAPLRMRVSMSARIESSPWRVPLAFTSPGPAPCARDCASRCGTYAEPTVEGSRPPAERTAIVCPDPELRGRDAFTMRHVFARFQNLPTMRLQTRNGMPSPRRSAFPRRRSGPWCRSRSSVP